ncbi:cytochrome P450 [Peniophora sp. CONT]|nr:cytochrome P450 [Peniophora sp. CONT]
MSSLDHLELGLADLLATPHLGLKIAGTITGGISLYIVYLVYQHFKWPAYTLPGPPLRSILHGSAPPSARPDPAALYLHEGWFKQYGPTIRHWDTLLRPGIITVDPTALRHMLNSSAYEKGQELKHLLGDILGEGLLFVEGAEHKRQRRVMNPAFGPLQVKGFTETFLRKSLEMRDLWLDLCGRNATREDGYLRIDAFAWLNKVTLDIIGLAGFDYDIDSLHAPDESPNELTGAVRTLFSFDIGVGAMLQLLLPGARHIPTKRVREQAKAQKLLTDIGMRLIASKKAAILRETSFFASSGVEKKDIQGSDLLTLLLRANIASDLPESARMSDKDIVSQVPTFLIAGHETTSTAVTWGLYAMACDIRVQQKLREELSTVSTDTPTDTELNQLPYLDAVVREILRVYAPVYITDRTAIKDDIVPLKTPVVGRDGVLRTEIHVSKGDRINFPIQIINRREEYWGEDAHQFRPERWSRLPDTVKDLPGVWSNMLTFFGGAHACIGYRFSIAEMKAILFTIVRSFEFELPIAPMDVTRKTMIVGRPLLTTDPAAGNQLPLLIRPVSA